MKIKFDTGRGDTLPVATMTIPDKVQPPSRLPAPCFSRGLPAIAREQLPVELQELSGPPVMLQKAGAGSPEYHRNGKHGLHTGQAGTGIFEQFRMAGIGRLEAGGKSPALEPLRSGEIQPARQRAQPDPGCIQENNPAVGLELPGIIRLKLRGIHLEENTCRHRQQLLPRNRHTETMDLESCRAKQRLNRALAAVLLVVLENEKADLLIKQWPRRLRVLPC